MKLRDSIKLLPKNKKGELFPLESLRRLKTAVEKAKFWFLMTAKELYRPGNRSEKRKRPFWAKAWQPKLFFFFLVDGKTKLRRHDILKQTKKFQSHENGKM